MKQNIYDILNYGGRQHLDTGGVVAPAPKAAAPGVPAPQSSDPVLQHLIDTGFASGGHGIAADVYNGAGNVVDYIGKSIGSTPAYTTNPADFRMPGFGNYQRQDIQNANMSGAHAGQAYSDQAGARLNQQQLIQLLQSQASGGGPNPAGMQERIATDRNLAQAHAIAAANPNNGSTLRNVESNLGNINQTAAADSATQRMQQMLAAQSELGGVIQGERGQDQGVLGQNLQAQLGFLGQGIQGATTEMGGAIDKAKIDAGVAENSAGRGASAIGGLLSGGASALGLGASGGGSGPAVPDVSSGSVYISSGGRVPGRASVDGDSPSNDTVPAMLSPGEVVVPKSVVDDPDKTAEFLAAVRKGKGPKPTFKDVLTSHRKMSQRLQELEAYCYGGRA